MIVKNLGNYSYDRVEFVGLLKNKKYWFPHAFKYVAWFIVISCVITSSVILMLYGMSFGMIKTYLWATTFGASFLIGLFITAPVRILVFSFLNSVFFKKEPVILTKKIPLSLLSNPPNKRNKRKILKYRKSNANLYSPTPLYKLQSRFEDIKYNIELRNLTVDTIAYVFFMISVCYLVLINKTEMSFYSNKMVSELVLSGKYTGSIPFKAVCTYEKFLEYLNTTLLPALLLESPKSAIDEIPDDIFGKNKRSAESDRKRKRQIPDNLNDTDIKDKVFDKGWTMNHFAKLLGKPRLRQVRVKGICKYLPELKARNYECAPELNILNVESGDFALRWDSGPPVGLVESQALPWTYQSAWKTGTLPIFGKFSNYPGGGYVLDFARHIDDARIVLNFLDEFQWVDIKTRAIFVEFTLYNVNVNLFSVVTLNFEKSATGYIIPSYQIDTCKFIFVANELQYFTFIMAGVFALLLFFFLLRESVRIHRTSFKVYMGWSFAMLDLVIILLGALSLLFLILRGYYVSRLLNRLEKADNNEFVSFIYAARWHSYSVYIEAILIFLAAFKFLRLLTFRVIFFQLQATLNYCYKHFIYLSTLQLIFLIAFADFFYLTLINCSEKFSNVGNSLSTLFGRSVAFDDTFDLHLLSGGCSFLTAFFFWLFIVFIVLLFVKVFTAIVCLYFHVIRRVPLTNKYNILDYIKFFLTRNQQSDILQLKYKKNIFGDDEEKEIMRLKGGGNAFSRKWKIKKKRKEKNEKKEETEPRKILLKDFITENIYDPVRYIDLRHDRTFAMRNLVASVLTDNEEERMAFRENAMKILFCNFISLEDGLKRREPNEIKGPYFSAIEKSETEVLDRRVFYNMRKIIEDFGKEKGWLADDSQDKEIASLAEKLKNLEEKLCLLISKLDQK